MFTVDTSSNLPSCGIAGISLTNDTNGNPFVSNYANNFITIDSNNELVIPTHSEMSQVSFYVRAITKGNQVAYKQIKVNITSCGSEIVTSNYPYYWNITVPYGSGLYKT